MGMAELRQMDVVWVLFPYSNAKGKKFRPAVIVSNNEYNKKNHDVVACAVTSRLDRKEYCVFIDQTNMQEGRMPIRSCIRADKIISVEKRLIDRMFARLDEKTFDALVKEVIKLVKRG